MGLGRGAARLVLVFGLLSAGGCVADGEKDDTGLTGVAVPADLVPVIVSAGDSCPAVTPARLAGTIMAATRFDRAAAGGIAGLSDAQWRQWQPWPGAQRQDAAANVTALAHELCDLVGRVRVAGLGADNWDLAVAAHHSGIELVLGMQAVPQSALTFVSEVTAYTAWYSRVPELAPPSVAVLAAPTATKPVTAGGTTRPVAPAAGPPTGPSAASTGPATASATIPAAGATKTPAVRRTTAAATGTTYQIVGFADKCVHAPAAADGTRLRLSTCSGAARQQWVFTGGTIRMGGLCIDIANAAQADGTAIQLATCNGGWAQQFWINGSNDLVNSAIGKCVDVTERGTADGTPLQLWACNGAANQKWTRTAR